MLAAVTSRLRIVRMTVPSAQHLLDGRTPPASPGYPGEQTLVAAAMIALDDAALGVWTAYEVIRADEGLLVGGIGFVAPPDANGAVEIWAEIHDADVLQEAVTAFVGFATELTGVTSVAA